MRLHFGWTCVFARRNPLRASGGLGNPLQGTWTGFLDQAQPGARKASTVQWGFYDDTVRAIQTTQEGTLSNGSLAS